jgi:hypothetical protein
MPLGVIEQWQKLAASVQELASRARKAIMERPDVQEWGRVYSILISDASYGIRPSDPARPKGEGWKEYAETFKLTPEEVIAGMALVNGIQSDPGPEGHGVYLPHIGRGFHTWDKSDQSFKDRIDQTAEALTALAHNSDKNSEKWGEMFPDTKAAYKAIGGYLKKATQLQYPTLYRVTKEMLDYLVINYPESYKLFPWAVKQLKSWLMQVDLRSQSNLSGGQYGAAHSMYNVGANHLADIVGQAGKLLAEMRAENRIPEGFDVNQLDFKGLEDWVAEQNRIKADQAVADEEIAYQWPDGWTIRKVDTEAGLAREGELMGHCVGGYCNQVDVGNSIIYSLRDPKNEPHVTIEFMGKSARDTSTEEAVGIMQMYPHQHPDALGEDDATWNIVQIQGKSNREPVDQYKARIKDWFTHLQTQGAQLERQRYGQQYHIDDVQSLIGWYNQRGHQVADEYGVIRPGGQFPQVDTSVPRLIDECVSAIGSGTVDSSLVTRSMVALIEDVQASPDYVRYWVKEVDAWIEDAGLARVLPWGEDKMPEIQHFLSALLGYAHVGPRQASMLTTLDDVVDQIAMNGGGSWYPDDLSPFGASDGYVVSVAGHEQTISDQEFDTSRLERYIIDHAEALSEPDVLLGAWVDNDLVYLDVSRYIRDRDSAIQFGCQNGQQAIWDAAAQDSITLNCTKESRYVNVDLRFAQPGEEIYRYDGALIYMGAPEKAWNAYVGDDLAGSVAYNDYPQDVVVQGMYVKPEYRDSNVFQALAGQIVAMGKPIDAAFRNPRLQEVFMRAMDRGRIPKHAAHDWYQIGYASGALRELIVERQLSHDPIYEHAWNEILRTYDAAERNRHLDVRLQMFFEGFWNGVRDARGNTEMDPADFYSYLNEGNDPRWSKIASRLTEIHSGDPFLTWQGEEATFNPDLNEGSRGVAMYDNNELVGSLLYQVRSDSIYLLAAYVKPEYRHQHVFTQLLGAAVVDYPNVPLTGKFAERGSVMRKIVDQYNETIGAHVEHDVYPGSLSDFGQKTSRTTMYHVAPVDARADILQNGIDHRRADNWYTALGLIPSSSEYRANYLWDTPENARTYMDWVQDPVDLYQVDVSGLHLLRDPYFHQPVWEHDPVDPAAFVGPHGIHGAFMTRDPISPDKILGLIGTKVSYALS